MDWKVFAAKCYPFSNFCQSCALNLLFLLTAADLLFRWNVRLSQAWEGWKLKPDQRNKYRLGMLGISIEGVKICQIFPLKNFHLLCKHGICLVPTKAASLVDMLLLVVWKI